MTLVTFAHILLAKASHVTTPHFREARACCLRCLERERCVCEPQFPHLQTQEAGPADPPALAVTAEVWGLCLPAARSPAAGGTGSGSPASTLGAWVEARERAGLRANSGVWFPGGGCVWGLLSLLLVSSSRRVFKVAVMTAIVFSSFSLEWHPLVRAAAWKGFQQGRGAVTLAGGS